MFLAALIIIIISLLVFLPTFNLALTGDDWLAFYRYLKELGPTSHWNHLTYFLTPYGAQDIWMGLLHKIYGNDPTPYYLTSFVFREIAAFSFYPLVKYLTKNKTAAFFAVFFFSITPVGLDTTNWVFNMPSYITVALFNLFLLFFLKAREEKGLKTLLISGLFYYLAYVITPIRMHGSLLLILLIEAFWLLQVRSKQTLKKIGIRLALILFIFLVIRYTGHSQGPPEEVSQRLALGIQADTAFLSTGRFDFIFYPIVMFGSMFIPDLAVPPNQIASSTQFLSGVFLPAFIGFVVVIVFMAWNLPIPRKLFTRYALIMGVAWSVLVMFIRKGNPTSFSNSQYLFLLLIGGYFLGLVIFLLIHYFKQTKISGTIFLATAWSILAFFFAWWWVPQSIFPTTYRYLIVSVMGVSILLATLISLGKSTKQQLTLLTFLIILTIVHISSTFNYFSLLQNIRSKDTYNKIWSSIPYVAQVGRSARPLVFYFQGDPTNGGILHDVITFGFSYHMAQLYNIREDNKLPVVMDTWDEVVSAVKDGKSFKKHYGIGIDPIPVENVYAFKLEGKDNLVDMTDEARKKLKEI